MKILVCGGRHWNGYWYRSMVWAVLNRVRIKMQRPTEIVHGNAKGVDTLASKWADTYGVSQKRYPANWDKYGKAAGMIRNKDMLDDNPDIEMVIAFPGGRGTDNMVALAKDAGKYVLDLRGKAKTDG